MAKVRYIDHEGAADKVEVFGVTFKADEEMDVEDDVAERLKGNRFFDQWDSARAKSATNPDLIEAVHRGRGVYAIVRGDGVLKEGLAKEDADAFNQLSDEDRAEYVK